MNSILQSTAANVPYLYIRGVGCHANIKSCVKAMKLTKMIHRKTDERQVYHCIISFHSDDNVTPEELLDMAEEFVRSEFAQYQALLAVHLDTDNLHCHTLINSVSIAGCKLHIGRKDFQKMRERLNSILLEYGKEPLKGFEARDFTEVDLNETDELSYSCLELDQERECSVVPVVDDNSTNDLQMSEYISEGIGKKAPQAQPTVFLPDTEDEDDDDCSFSISEECKRLNPVEFAFSEIVDRDDGQGIIESLLADTAYAIDKELLGGQKQIVFENQVEHCTQQWSKPVVKPNISCQPSCFSDDSTGTTQQERAQKLQMLILKGAVPPIGITALDSLSDDDLELIFIFAESFDED